jgi:predicted metal-dependent HD superfamily phosphohydrolase
MQNKISMKQFVIDMLKKKLPANYYYHNDEHTLYVQEKAIEIGKHEGCNEKEIELLSAAALWHDTGYINAYTGHEEASCLLAKKYLPLYGYSEKDIVQIIGMIMATKILQTPTNKLEEILADADLEYLGTNAAAEIAHLLFKELQSLNSNLTVEAYNTLQIKFLNSHHYFTNYCKVNKDPIRNAYHKKLMEAER